MFMVSLRSFPWNGNVPVSISNCKHESRKCHKQPSFSTRWVLEGEPYHEYSQRPPVCTLCVSSPVDHLRGHILHRTTEGISLLVSIHRLFTQAKVCMAAKKEKSETHGWWNSRIHKCRKDNANTVLSTTNKGESWTSVKLRNIPVNFICPASSSKMLKDKNMFSDWVKH